MGLSKLIHGFVKDVLCISCPLPNKTKLKFDQDFKACRSFFFELKVLNELKFSMPWVRCAFANVLNWGLCSFLLLYQGDIYWRSSKYWGHFRIKTYVRIIPFFIDIVNIVIIVSCSWMLEGLSLMTVISPALCSQWSEAQYLSFNRNKNTMSERHSL